MRDEPPKDPDIIQAGKQNALRQAMLQTLTRSIIFYAAEVTARTARDACKEVNSILYNSHFEGNDAMRQAIEKTAGAVDVSGKIGETMKNPAPIKDIKDAQKRAEDRLSDNISAIVNEITKSLVYSMPDAISDALYNNLLDGITEALGEEQRRLNEFYKSEQWAELQAAFPDITEDDGMLILFSGLADQITESLPELKAKIAEYEKETGDSLTFWELTDIEDEDGQPIEEPLLSKFLQEIRKERAEKQREEIVHFNSPGLPKKHTIINTILTNALRALDGKGELIGAGEQLLSTLNIGKNNEITIIANAELKGVLPKDPKDPHKYYNTYDNAVNNAVCSLWLDRTERGREPIITMADVCKVMTRNEKISPLQIKYAEESFNKMRLNLYVRLDASDEAKARNYLIDGKPIDGFVIGDFLISASEMIIETGGKKKTAYRLKDAPLQLQYALMNNQYYTVPADLLDIKKLNKEGVITTRSESYNRERISVTHYLLQRILVMQSDEKKAQDNYRQYENRRQYKIRQKKTPNPEKNISDFRNLKRIILFDSIFEAAESTDKFNDDSDQDGEDKKKKGKDKNKKTRIREFAFSVLENWKQINYKNTGRGFIKDFEKRKKGKTIDAVIIELW